MTPRPLRIALSLSVLACLAVHPARAMTLPTNFVTENAVPNVAFDTPTRIAFLPTGRMLVAEKRGRVWAVSNGVRDATPLWQREAEVLNESDRGLLAIAVDPNYVVNHYLYFLYTVDPDSNSVDDEDDAFGRLTRYTVSFSDSTTVDYSTRTVLMGATWATGPTDGSPSHTVGDLRWGRDGSLLISVGDGAQYTLVDRGGVDNAMFGPGKASAAEDIGAFRSQWIGSLCGKILRVDPATGQGYPSNPYWNGNGNAVQSKVWCYGMRNPFRFARRPGTGFTNPSFGSPGTLFIGDVGWNEWEEQNIARSGGKNFGWPCYEGLGPNAGYQAATPFHHGCTSIGQGDNLGTLTPPAVTYHHSDPNGGTPPGFIGNTAIGGVFYTAAIYPAQYQNQLFIADFGQRWIRLAQVDVNDNITALTLFATDVDGPVDLETDPLTGNVYCVAIIPGLIQRIRWTGPVGNNAPPVAVATGSPTSGIAPLSVVFNSDGTSDPNFDPLLFTWNFGDGTGSTLHNPVHTYTNGADYQAVLTVDDGRGGVSRDTVLISATGTNQFPSTPVLDDFNRPDGAIGGAWSGDIAGMMVNDGQATTTCCDVLGVWSGLTFGPNQEAYYTFGTVQPESQELMLKVQGDSWADGYLEVRYDAGGRRVWMFAYSPAAGYVGMGSFAATYGPGDRFGARAWNTGLVQVFKNGTMIGTGSAPDWPFNASGGRVGVILGSTYPTLLDDFGGGDIVINTAPTAITSSPLDSTFYVAGDTLTFSGTGSDAQQSAASLQYEWRVHLHHNNHVHPSVHVALGPTASFVPENHEDGTGVWYEVQLRVTDNGGLADTASVNIFPEADLVPSAVALIPAYPGTLTSNEYRFKIYNLGRMPASTSRWRLMAGPVQLAEGDARVEPLDSISVRLTLPPMLGPGQHTLRLIVDTLNVVVETDEANNAHVQPLIVVNGSSTVDVPGGAPPRVLALSNAQPSPSRGAVTFALDLPASTRVAFAVHDLLGRRVWAEPELAYDAGRWTLRWDGRTTSGAGAPPGIYRARVTVGGTVLVRPITRLR